MVQYDPVPVIRVFSREPPEGNLTKKWILSYLKKRDGTKNFAATFRFTIANLQTFCSHHFSSSWFHHLIDHNRQEIQNKIQFYSRFIFFLHYTWIQRGIPQYLQLKIHMSFQENPFRKHFYVFLTNSAKEV